MRFLPQVRAQSPDAEGVSFNSQGRRAHVWSSAAVPGDAALLSRHLRPERRAHRVPLWATLWTLGQHSREGTIQGWRCWVSILPPARFRNISSVQSLSRVQLFAAPWTAACRDSLSVTNSWSSPKPMSISWMIPSSQRYQVGQNVHLGFPTRCYRKT